MDVFSFFKILLTGTLFLLIVAVTFYDNVLVALFLSPYLYIWYREHFKEKQKEKKTILKKQFKDGMQSVAFSLNTGSSIENSFRHAVLELEVLYGKDSMIVREFQKISMKLACNENIEDIFEEFAIRSQVDDIAYFSAVFRYAKRCGGDLLAIIAHTAQRLSEKNETETEIQTVISGKKMEQKVMSIIPFVIILYLKISSYEFVEPLYHNLLGIVVMTVCFGVYLAANVLAKRIINIEV